MAMRGVLEQTGRIVLMTRLHKAVAALGTLMIFLSALSSGQDRSSTPEPTDAGGDLGLCSLMPDAPSPCFTRYPATVYVYMQAFQPCSSDVPCTRTDRFRLNPLPNRCCSLMEINGNGQFEDRVLSYEVFLNGKRIASVNRFESLNTLRFKVLRSNKLKVILTGEPSSKLFVLIGYYPPQSK